MQIAKICRMLPFTNLQYFSQILIIKHTFATQ
jgi:hypothetical protein